MKIKDRCKTDKKLKLYRVPKSVYQKALAEIFRKETSREKYNKRCHVRKFQYFKTNCRPLCLGNLMEACKQAFEDRDWKQLYIFLTKAMSYKGYQFRQQYLEVSSKAYVVQKAKSKLNVPQFSVLIHGNGKRH